jgi:uracil-DNA glycosylase
LRAEVKLLRPRLVIPVGKLAIEQLFPELEKLTEIIGTTREATLAGHTFDVIALPHPSGASTWHRTEPGKTLLVRALAKIAQHDAWRSIVEAPVEARAS